MPAMTLRARSEAIGLTSQLVKPVVCVALLVFVAPGVAVRESAEQNEFWKSLRALCGNAYAGKVIESAPYAKDSVGRREVIHVRECTDHVVRIAYQPPQRRALTWVITRNAQGLRFEHHDRWMEGRESGVNEYGGSTRSRGTATRQEFPADKETGARFAELKALTWIVEIMPSRTFAYTVQRKGAAGRFRVEFDLSKSADNLDALLGYRWRRERFF